MARNENIIVKFQVYCSDCKNDHMEIEFPIPASIDVINHISHISNIGV
jgi:hypothetical protein